MLADGVDFANRCAGMYEGAIGLSEVVEGNLVIDRFFGGCGPSAAHQVNHQRRFIDGVERLQQGLSGADGFWVGQRMSAVKVTEAANLKLRIDGTGDNSFETRARYFM